MSPVVPRFELSQEGTPSGAHLICVSGEIHVSTAPKLAAPLSDAIHAGCTLLVIDMTGVEFIDSTGLGVLLNGLRLVGQMQGRLAIVCTNPTVLRLFQITALDDTFDIFDDRAQAIAHVTQPPGPDEPDPAAGSGSAGAA